MQYLGHTYTKKFCCSLSEIHISLGILYFYLLKLATLYVMLLCINIYRIVKFSWYCTSRNNYRPFEGSNQWINMGTPSLLSLTFRME